jgi:hypothetical protein
MRAEVSRSSDRRSVGVVVSCWFWVVEAMVVDSMLTLRVGKRILRLKDMCWR